MTPIELTALLAACGGGSTGGWLSTTLTEGLSAGETSVTSSASQFPQETYEVNPNACGSSHPGCYCWGEYTGADGYHTPKECHQDCVTDFNTYGNWADAVCADDESCCTPGATCEKYQGFCHPPPGDQTSSETGIETYGTTLMTSTMDTDVTTGTSTSETGAGTSGTGTSTGTSGTTAGTSTTGTSG